VTAPSRSHRAVERIFHSGLVERPAERERGGGSFCTRASENLRSDCPPCSRPSAAPTVRCGVPMDDDVVTVRWPKRTIGWSAPSWLKFHRWSDEKQARLWAARNRQRSARVIRPIDRKRPPVCRAPPAAMNRDVPANGLLGIATRPCITVGAGARRGLHTPTCVIRVRDNRSKRMPGVRDRGSDTIRSSRTIRDAVGLKGDHSFRALRR